MRNLQQLQTGIGKKVKALRNQKAWAQETLANKAETGISYISEIESGKANLQLETLWRIADALQVDVKILFEE